MLDDPSPCLPIVFSNNTFLSPPNRVVPHFLDSSSFSDSIPTIPLLDTLHSTSKDSSQPIPLPNFVPIPTKSLVYTLPSSVFPSTKTNLPLCSSPIDSTLPVRKSTRTKLVPSYLQDYHYLLVSSSSSSPESHHSGTPYLIQQSISYSHLSHSQESISLAISTPVESRFYHDAVKSSQWCDAMAKEIAALEENHTWILTPLSASYKQREGFDYFVTLSPVAKLVTVRCFIALVAAQGWSIVQLDVNNAFRHGELDEEVFMNLPTSFNSKGEPNNLVRKYAVDILQDYGFLGSKALKLSMKQHLKLSKDDGPLLPDPTLHKRLFDRLLYLTHSYRHFLFYYSLKLVHGPTSSRPFSSSSSCSSIYQRCPIPTAFLLGFASS
uniref:Reverse transcriptase Ty1/copia-type domain-containing protein n=1 Tax=Fagus sylvatica TaxID=28930 RepID=A0A2N9J9H1_FAGSY